MESFTVEFHSTGRYAPRIFFAISLGWFLLMDFITNSSWRGVRVTGKQHWCWFLRGVWGAAQGGGSPGHQRRCLTGMRPAGRYRLPAVVAAGRPGQQEGLTGKVFCPGRAQHGGTGSPGQHALRDSREGAGWQAGAASCSGASWKKGAVFARQPPCHL